MHMAKVLKWLGVGLAGLLGLILLAVVVLFIIGNNRVNQTYQVTPLPVEVSAGAESLARGEHLVEVACKSCHGADLSGQPLMDEPGIGTIYTANLTRGKGGILSDHTQQDLVRAIRHGVGHDGRKLFIMPAESFIFLSAEDLGAIIAYLQTIPPVDNEIPDPKLTLVGRVLLGAGLFGQPFPAEYVDHETSFVDMPEIGANLAYGFYLTRVCTSCHGEDLAGKQPGDPASPFAPNLTMGGELIGWSETDFVSSLRTGVTPSGHELNPEAMPWKSFGKFHDKELSAIWMYLQSLPATETSASN
jgi:mono/diheme cytochrome c family protein